MDESREIVQVTGLRKRYRAEGPEAVAGIDFAVREGEIFGLLGPNGAGKTTTIGIVTTRVKPTGGTALVDGHDVAREPVEAKRRIAVVPQLSNLDRSLTAIENLTFHAAYFGAGRRERRRRAMELLERFGLGDRANEKVGRYSGGMAQRLMIARALMHQPLVLFLDEPTTGLDPQSRLFLWETMLDLRGRGTTLVLTTHDMSEADRLCDRIAIVDHGSIIALDTPRGLRGVLPATAGIDVVLESEVEPPAEAFQSIDGAEKVEVGSAGEGRWRVRVYGEHPRLAQGALAVAQNGALTDASLLELRRIEGSLEDVFMHLTGREMR
ncbi:MAG TPA: ABC transporter ATP-binding protein [Conexibacter sp.]|jgi:ABC-2 type transport system ATP-binding protein